MDAGLADMLGYGFHHVLEGADHHLLFLIALAQLVTIAVVLPSLHLASRTRLYPGLRLAGASVTFAAATGWALEHLGVLDNPVVGVEQALVGHPWWVVAGLAAVAVGCWLADRRLPARRGRLVARYEGESDYGW